jgi:hypothetical protein
MSKHTIDLSDDHEAILTFKAMGQDVTEYLQKKSEGMAEESRPEYEASIKQKSMEKVKLAAEIPELKADYEALIAKVDAEIAKKEAEVPAEEKADEKG